MQRYQAICKSLKSPRDVFCFNVNVHYSRVEESCPNSFRVECVEIAGKKVI